MATLFDEMLKKAKAGDTDAQMTVAEAYFKGIGVLPSAIESLHWLEQAADKNKNASLQIVNMYMNGYGVPQNKEKGFEIAEKYANKGNEIQMFNLAGYYLNGIGTNANLDKAIECYEKAYEMGYFEAPYFLGYIYQTNQEVKDTEKMLKWYQVSADMNDPRACYNLAYIYYDGSAVIKDNAKALEYANKALNAGLTQAQELINLINSDNGYFGYSRMV